MNYGIWGEKASSISKHTKPGQLSLVLNPLLLAQFILGQLVKMTGSRLRNQCVSIPDHTVLVTCFQHEQLVGHAFASVWPFEGGTSICVFL
jgi:hypothetical protein